MLEKDLLEIERDVIGEIWQSGEMHRNHRFMADELGSRFAGTESEIRAKEYMVSKFKEYGYENAFAEPFEYYGWKRGPATLETIEPYKREFPVISLAVSPGGASRG